ncbi:TonB-dependent siderophore receptor [Acinetobacter puyangensis]|uniref:TonB-dependent siderophore receptor n=1 Tax=Acinetobacter puyangensis TaxID=1096779 RepID=UPI003A4E6704
MYLAQKSILASSVTLAMLFAVQVHAEEINSENAQVLPTITVKAETETDPYVATKATSVLKSDAPLFETAQSISVITEKQLQQKQAATLAEAIEGIAGVTSGQYGRRGWDDFIIRGQISSSQTYMDGLRMQTSDNLLRAVDISGLESIEVVKGPTSVGFGLALPGGLVNLTTKRPQAETFYRGTLSYGSYALTQGTFDINYAPNNSEKGAFRVVGRISDQDDPTDYVYFKNYYIAPSYNFDLGEKSDLSVIASYQHSDYIRQQGIPHNNTTTYKNYSHSLFFGEPDKGYETDVYRLGTNFSHQFDNDWLFKQNFAVTQTHTLGSPVLASSNSSLPSIRRQINNQDKQDINYALDNNLQHSFNFGRINYNVLVGVDMMRERSDYYRRNDTINAFNANNPVYGVTSITTGSPTQELTYNQYTGLYLRNTIKVDDKWIIGLSGRHDWTQVEIRNLLRNTTTKNSDNAFTGSASVMYQWNNAFAPYISYSTSFMPVTDSGENGVLLKPEEGKQAEVGVKWQALNQKLQGYVAYYDLVRKNVTEADASLGYSVQTGEQTTKGFETEIVAALSDQWNILGSYSYIPTAETTESLTATEIGKRTNHVPEHAGTISTQYFFSPDKLGWNIGGGIRYQGSRTAQRASAYIDLPDYTLFDVSAGYEAKHWGAGLTIKNLFDKDYLVGTTPNAQLVNWGDPRMFRFNVKFKY